MSMQLLSRLRLRSKLALLLGMAAIGVAGSIVAGASTMHQRMLDDRIDKLRIAVDMTVSLAKGLEANVQAGKLTRQQAIDQLVTNVHVLRYDRGAGYMIIQRADDDVVLAHGLDPKREGLVSSVKTADGRTNADQIRDVLRDKDQGLISYPYAKPGETEQKDKLSIVSRFAPWNLIVFSGAWVDDIDADYHTVLRHLGIIGGLILLATLFVAWLINHDITGSLGRLRATMYSLTHGDLTVAVPGTDRRDEVGAMAQAVLVFQQEMRKAEQLTAERAESETAAAAEKKAALVRMAEAIRPAHAAPSIRLAAGQPISRGPPGTCPRRRHGRGPRRGARRTPHRTLWCRCRRWPVRRNSLPPRSRRSASRSASPPWSSAARWTPGPRPARRSRR
jgi:methyl-accepting chemotaxis protein